MENFVSHQNQARVESYNAVLWSQRLPYDEWMRFCTGFQDSLLIGFASLDPSLNVNDLLYNADVHRIILWHNRTDMIIRTVRFTVADTFWEFNLVILERDEAGRNRYWLFHRSLDTRLEEYGVEF